MSAILLTYLKIFDFVSVFLFSAVLICNLFRSIFLKNNTQRAQENNQTQDDSLDEFPAKEEDLIADVVNGETLIFLHYKSEERDAVHRICEITKTHQVICGSDSSPYQECDQNGSDEMCQSGADEKSGEEEVSDDHEEESCFGDEPQASWPRKEELEEKDNGEKNEEKKDNFVAMVQFTSETMSKSSWEWRSSTNYRDSEMEDMYSSSSYSADSLFIKKYDEDMLYIDRITVQKLQETESFRITNPLPRSLSKRIMINLRGSLEDTRKLWQNEKTPQEELEAAYVAQICLTWEALNWNYKNFKKLKTGKEDGDFGYYAQVAEQCQQFQVLLQRFIEIEPYEHGRRPEIYARMRTSRPKLLQVPEIREGNSDGEAKEETKMPTAELLGLMEDSIRIFMEFLMTEKSKKCILVRTLFRRSASPYTWRIHAVRKAAQKKRKELKEIHRRHKCFTRWKMNKAVEFEILLALIDIKVVLRVLKMAQINEDQLHWCEQKINKLRVERDKIQRDSFPLFYPSR